MTDPLFVLYQTKRYREEHECLSWPAVDSGPTQPEGIQTLGPIPLHKILPPKRVG